MSLAFLPSTRLLRTRRAWVPILGWTAFAVAGAMIARAGGAVRGADHALLGAYATVELPLLVYGVVAAALGGDSLARSGASQISLGASPFGVARATVLVSVAASATIGAVLAVSVAALAHGPQDPPLAADVARCAEIGALGGAAYGAFFTLGASFGARGFGRSLLLLVDWFFGVGHGSSAVLTPRAHIRSLLGGVAPLHMTARSSFMALTLLAFVCSALAVQRAGRAEWPLPRR